MTVQRWQDYWSDRSTPEYSLDDVGHYREYAGELRLLLGERPERVLDIGCGNGALYPHLRFHRCARYLGVDFSPSMLAGFRYAHPGVDLRLAEGSRFRADEEFDVVFSSQVAQYWSRAELAAHLDNALGMLAPDGRIVVSGIPWSRMRFAYARGDMTGGRRRAGSRALLSYAAELAGQRLGNWYEPAELAELARARGLAARWLGSMYYPYRFHAVLEAATVSRAAPAPAGPRVGSGTR